MIFFIVKAKASEQVYYTSEKSHLEKLQSRYTYSLSVFILASCQSFGRNMAESSKHSGHEYKNKSTKMEKGYPDCLSLLYICFCRVFFCLYIVSFPFFNTWDTYTVWQWIECWLIVRIAFLVTAECLSIVDLPNPWHKRVHKDSDEGGHDNKDVGHWRYSLFLCRNL